MKEIVLSDYVGENVRNLASKRRGDYQSGMSDYESKRAARGASVRRRAPLLIILFVALWAALFFVLWRMAGGAPDFTGSNEYILTIALASLAPASAAFFIGYRIYMPSRPRQASAGKSENIWNAGKEGEDRVAAALNGVLGDDWTLFRGYRNPGGEIDQVLVGPPGVVAIEVKYVNGKVHISGDKWTRDRYDNYGNLVERGASMSDAGGRSPSAQLNAAASRLEWFLEKRSPGAGRVSRAVVLSHDKSELGRISKPSVDYALTLKDVRRGGRRSAMLNRPPRLDRRGAERIARLIERDHRCHANGRGGRGGGSRPRRRARESGALDCRLRRLDARDTFRLALLPSMEKGFVDCDSLLILGGGLAVGTTASAA